MTRRPFSDYANIPGFGDNSDSVVKTQNAQVLRHLIEFGALTPQEALTLYHCFRLAARIFDLRALGHQILTTRVKNRWGNPFALYHLLRLAQPKEQK